MVRRFLAGAALVVQTIVAFQTAAALPDSVVKDFGRQLSSKICADGGAWLKCYRLEPSRCSSVVGEIVSSCSAQSLGSVTGVMSYEDAMVKARRIDSCVNEKFLAAYGFQKESSADCSQPPPHLRGEG